MSELSLVKAETVSPRESQILLRDLVWIQGRGQDSQIQSFFLSTRFPSVVINHYVKSRIHRLQCWIQAWVNGRLTA